MLDSSLRIPLIADEDDVVLGDAGFFCGSGSYREKRCLGDQDFGTGILQLEGQLVGCIGWVGWGDNAAGPDSPPHHGRGVDAVGGEQGQHVSLLPVEVGLEALAEGQGCIFDLLVGIRSLCVCILVDNWAGVSGETNRSRASMDWHISSISTQYIPLSSGKARSFRSKRKDQTSTSGIWTGGYREETGMATVRGKSGERQKTAGGGR